jgi:hypothetical protein
MKVLVLSGNTLEEREIKNTLEDLQDIVGGYIEIPFLSRVFNDNKIDVIINEKGKFIEGLEPEIVVMDRATQRILDVVYGNCVFASHDYEGNTIALNEEQKSIVKSRLSMDMVLYNPDTDKHYIVKALYV